MEKIESLRKDSSITCPFDNLIRAITAQILKNFLIIYGTYSIFVEVLKPLL